MKKHLTLILAVLLVIATGAAVYALSRDEVVATVNGEKITKNELYNALVENGGKAVLEQLISTRIVAQQAEKLGIKIIDKDIDTKIEQIINDNYYCSREYFEQALTQYGLTEETLKQSIRIDLMMNQIIRSKTEVTDEEVEKHFADNQDDFNIALNVQVRHILVDTEDVAKEILQKLQDGADFAALAKEYSKDTASVEAGGDLGMIAKGQMVQEFEDVAFGQPVGLYGTPVKSQYGYHIIEVLKIQEAREVSFEEVKEDVKEALITSKVEAQIDTEYAALRDGAKVDNRLD